MFAVRRARAVERHCCMFQYRDKSCTSRKAGLYASYPRTSRARAATNNIDTWKRVPTGLSN
eukprot:6110619-Pleurochrysis_carterae.AAC.1